MKIKLETEVSCCRLDFHSTEMFNRKPFIFPCIGWYLISFHLFDFSRTGQMVCLRKSWCFLPIRNWLYQHPQIIRTLEFYWTDCTYVLITCGFYAAMKIGLINKWNIHLNSIKWKWAAEKKQNSCWEAKMLNHKWMKFIGLGLTNLIKFKDSI